MKELRNVITQRIAEAVRVGDDLQSLFTRKFPKSGYSRKWLERSLAIWGPRLLSEEGWLREIPKMVGDGTLPLTTMGDLAGHLRLGVEELAWFADRACLNPALGPLQHYRYQWIQKRKGSPRLLMEPKESLKLTQRRILETILNDIPLHESAHGFRAQRSVKTFATPHLGQKVVIRMDLADFFPTITQARVRGLFEMLGYRCPVATTLAALCTHAPPLSILKNLPWKQRKILSQRHLPQGAPTSPYLANAIAYRLDCRLAGLAEMAGLRYTRYADDLAFSGARIGEPFRNLVGSIVLEEGFELNHRKTQVMTSSQRQRLAGVVVNVHPNLERGEFDRLKAILYNCLTHGPVSQGFAERESHLRGKIASVQMLNPERGGKLLEIFRRIEWSH